MAHKDQLANYFASTRTWPENWIGSEIETFFVGNDGGAITIEQSQAILERLVSYYGWIAGAYKGEFLTEARKGTSRVQYELGYPNIELSVCPYERKSIVKRSRYLLEELYCAAEVVGAYPLFTPVFGGEENYLAMPDERDAAWLKLDSPEALSPLARISAVQFTINVKPKNAIDKLNLLLLKSDDFIKKYPQEQIWRKYISSSSAGYRSDRYGGPDGFESLSAYCFELSKHAVVSGSQLVPFESANLMSDESISLFLRSIWWYFRLRRYGQNLCIEVRPLPRLRDECLSAQLEEVLSIMG